MRSIITRSLFSYDYPQLTLKKGRDYSRELTISFILFFSFNDILLTCAAALL